MAQSRITGDNSFTLRVNQLASDWNVSQLEREAEFCKGVESLCADPDVGILRRTPGFNLFDVLGRQREDNYSHLIARLMDPSGPHGFKDLFLKAFFEKAFPGTALASTVGCRVTPKRKIDKGEVDIEVMGPEWCLIVENKIGCEEGQGQTEKYAAYYKQEQFAEIRKPFFVFLSPDGRPPKSPFFVPMSYSGLREVLESVRDSVRPARKAEQLVEDLIQHIRYELEN